MVETCANDWEQQTSKENYVKRELRLERGMLKNIGRSDENLYNM